MRPRRIREIEHRLRLDSGLCSHRVHRRSLSSHLGRLLWSGLISCEGLSVRHHHVRLTTFAFHFHSFGIRAISTTIFWSRSFHSCCVSINNSSRCRNFAIHSVLCLCACWWIAICWLCARSRRRCGCRILVLPHDAFQIGEHPPFLLVCKVELRSAVAL